MIGLDDVRRAAAQAGVGLETIEPTWATTGGCPYDWATTACRPYDV